MTTCTIILLRRQKSQILQAHKLLTVETAAGGRFQPPCLAAGLCKATIVRSCRLSQILWAAPLVSLCPSASQDHRHTDICGDRGPIERRDQQLFSFGFKVFRKMLNKKIKLDWLILPEQIENKWISFSKESYVKLAKVLHPIISILCACISNQDNEKWCNKT